jgi:hypothetical protein
VEVPPLFTKVQIRSPSIARQWIAALWAKSRRLLSGALTKSSSQVSLKGSKIVSAFDEW